jgi:TetR/AcrR family transcriptional regulator, copper-responsive repressor
MVQKSKKPRGRPRGYDAAAALAEATAAFWERGYAATSLDELSAATGMNRPSLYNEFGDKRALYRKALDQYAAMGRAAMDEALADNRPLAEGLRRVYSIALDLYFSGEVPRGCFMIGTAVTEAVADPELRRALSAGLGDFDAAFERRLCVARERGELPKATDPAMLARIASGVLYFLAIRSRAGETREVLQGAAEAAVVLICGGAGAAAAASL